MSDDGKVDAHDLEQAILEILKQGKIDFYLGRGFGGDNTNKGVVENIQEKYEGATAPSKARIAEAIWALVNRGLVYIDFTFFQGQERSSTECLCEKWTVQLTERGCYAVGDTTINPDKPEGFLAEFIRGVTGNVPDVVQMYVKEALKTYNDQSYLACAVMLGVAAEAAFFDMLESICNWLPATEGARLRAAVGKRGTPYSKLHEDFRRRLETHKGDLPPDLEADLDLRINAVLGLIRDYRNDSGHPTGKRMDRATCHVALVQFAYAMQRLFALKDFFDSQNQLPTS